jgi:hypothetical protein
VVSLRIEVDGNEVTLTGTTKGDPVDEQARAHTAWRWSGRAKAFVLPRNLTQWTRKHNIDALVNRYRDAGRDVEVVDTGTRLTVAEEREQERQRLEARQDRYEHRAERQEGESEGQYARYRQIADSIPLGQPILVDHYSAPGHRRALQRMDTAMRKSVEASKEAEEAARLASGLERQLTNGTPLVTLRRRIAKWEAEIRDWDRRLDGSRYGRKPAEGEYRDRLMAARQRSQEALDLDLAELARRAEEDGVKVWTRADFQKGDEVMDRYGEWVPVLRVNAKSVTTPHGIDGLAAAGHTWTREYGEIRGRRRDGVVTLTRADTEVKG